MRYSEGAAEGLLGTTPTIVARVVIRDSNVVLRLAIARHDCLLSCSRTCAHDDDGADTRHATTTERWTERPLSEALQYLYGLAAADSTRLIEMGAVWLQDLRITRRGVPVPPRARLRVHLRPRLYELPPQLGVVACTEAYVVCDKPSGVPVHATVDNVTQNLLAAMEHQLGLPLLPTSRLDVETSGLVVLARAPAAQTRFNALLGRRAVEKEYTALVALPDADGGAGAESALPPSLRAGPLVHWMERRERAPMRLSAARRDGWLRCESEILRARRVRAVPRRAVPCTLGTAAEADAVGVEVAEVSLRLHTGRTHQLRAQLSSIGHPVLGDALYGAAPLREVQRRARRAAPPPPPPPPPLPPPLLVVWLPETPFALHCGRLHFPTEGESGVAAVAAEGSTAAPCQFASYHVPPPWHRARCAAEHQSASLSSYSTY